MVFNLKDLIKFLKKTHKIHTIRKDIKNLKYVKTIKMYKILTPIHLNYKFKKITLRVSLELLFLNIQDVAQALRSTYYQH